MAWQPINRPRQPNILIVGEDRPQWRLRDVLEGAGYSLRFCPGPARRPCPALEGRWCTIRGHPVLAMIVRPADARGPFPPCGPELGIPAVGIREDWDRSDEPPLLPQARP